MQRSIMAVCLCMAVFLVSCSGGPPPIPTAVTIAPVNTTSSTTTATVDGTTQAATAASTSEPLVEAATAASTSEPLVEATSATTATAGAATSTATAEPVRDATAASTAAPQATAATQAVQPLGTEQCEQLWGEVAQTLGVKVDKTTATFQDEHIGAGTSCHLQANGTGAQFKPFTDVASDLRTLLLARGWTEDQAFAADGPTGTQSGYRMGDAVALVNVGWQPAEGVDCTGPIADCHVPREQQRFSVVLDLIEGVE